MGTSLLCASSAALFTSPGADLVILRPEHVLSSNHGADVVGGGEEPELLVIAFFRCRAAGNIVARYPAK